MTVFKVVAITDVFDAPGGNKIDTMLFNERVVSDGAVQNHFVKVDRGDEVDSFVREADFNTNLRRDDGSGAEPPIDEASYVSEAIAAERITNADENVPPAYVLADFVIARALIETGLANLGPQHAPSDATGPLQVSSAEWSRFLAEGGDLSEPFRADPLGRQNEFKQIHAATWTMHDNAKDISGLKATGTTAGSDGPFVPSYLDIFHAYLTDSAAAAVAILDAAAADPTKKMAQVLDGKVPADRIGKLFDGRKGFLGVTEPDNVGGFVKATSDVLAKALKDAFDKIKTNAPEEVLTPQGGAPWFTVAQAEEAANVDANDPGSKDRILNYFTATDHGRPSAIEAWCGAFVAFCLKQSGNPTAAASIPKGAALAANWVNWGAPLPIDPSKIPQGAVIVLAPQPGTTGSSGHVGFFVEFTQGGQKVKLLGGNQSHKVTRTEFAASGIRAARWLDLAPAQGVASGLKLPANVKPENRPNADLIVNAFAAAGFGRNQQVAAVANAIAESALNPMAHALGEDSVGLFQCRRIKGLGGNNSVEKLQDPNFNTQLVIAEAKKFPSFMNAADLQTAVFEFVKNVERPADPEGQSRSRLQIAQGLIA